MSEKARYRKINDGSNNSSSYHKKDGTSVRSVLKKELKSEIQEGQEVTNDCYGEGKVDSKRMSVGGEIIYGILFKRENGSYYKRWLYCDEFTKAH